MRILALDLGKKRIGLAVSDELGVTAQGLPLVGVGFVRKREDQREGAANIRAMAFLGHLVQDLCPLKPDLIDGA